MPQLKPIIWINFNFMIMMILVVLVIMYFYKKEEVKYMSFFKSSSIYLFKW